MTANTTIPKYIRVRNATMEMCRSLRKRESGEVVVDGCVVRWDTKERRVTLSGSDTEDVDTELIKAVRSVADNVQFIVAI